MRLARTLTAASLTLLLGSCSTIPTDEGPPKVSMEIQNATLGLSTSVPSDELSKALALDTNHRVNGRVIDSVEGLASEAGLREGDVLLKLGDVDLYSDDDIADFLSVSSPGARIPVAFKREGNTDVREAIVTLGKGQAVANDGSQIRWQFASLGQLPQALEAAQAQNRKVMVGLSGAET